MNQKQLTQAEREQIYLLKKGGQTILQIAETSGFSCLCPQVVARSRSKRSVCEAQARAVQPPVHWRNMLHRAGASLKLKQDHKRWEQPVLIELRKDTTLSGLSCPASAVCLLQASLSRMLEPLDQAQGSAAYAWRNGRTRSVASRPSRRSSPWGREHGYGLQHSGSIRSGDDCQSGIFGQN
jgi:hypothetical protein